MRRTLCAITDIPDGGGRGFGAAEGGFYGLFAVSVGEAVMIYVNACPHIHVPLDWAPDRFLSSDASRIICSTHGAEFEIETGLCTAGPCVGERLQAVPFRLENGWITVAADAGR